ncbi:hypothetical protein [Nannocystis sp. SCPEA4]|uniref:hypothetical protein n=1 Tax=Nannocystis sp. SCPEA4 TaxID=2996787 RepID=UPI00226DE008|nr:hypothetical protein [Nannocystis sp. SCPEA4]MCY1062672.1 hypothetical protein [Nannocystis sp. SCPEA4]
MSGQIPCPDCGGIIVFDAHALLRGETFACAGCGASLGLARESVATVANAMAKLDALRKPGDGRRAPG